MPFDIPLRVPPLGYTCWNSAASQIRYTQCLNYRDCELLAAIMVFLALITLSSGIAMVLAALSTSVGYWCVQLHELALRHADSILLSSYHWIVGLSSRSVSDDDDDYELHTGPLMCQQCSSEPCDTYSVVLSSGKTVPRTLVTFNGRRTAPVKRRRKIIRLGLKDLKRLEDMARPRTHVLQAILSKSGRKESPNRRSADLDLVVVRSHGSQQGSAARAKADGSPKEGHDQPGGPAEYDNPRKRPRRRQNQDENESDQSNGSDDERSRRVGDRDHQDRHMSAKHKPFLGRDWHGIDHFTYPCPFALIDPERYAHFNGACTKIFGSDPAKIV